MALLCRDTEKGKREREEGTVCHTLPKAVSPEATQTDLEVHPTNFRHKLIRLTS